MCKPQFLILSPFNYHNNPVTPLTTTNNHLSQQPTTISLLSLFHSPILYTTISPLLLLCRDIDATNLQQFEACMALTNLTSCGVCEQDKLVDEKGVGMVYGLMCSDHAMVRYFTSTRTTVKVFGKQHI